MRGLRNGGKSSNWKKAIPSKISLQENNWKNLDIKDAISITKKNIQDIEIDETDDKKVRFITLRFEDKDTYVFTANQEVLDQFYTGISLILNKPVENDYMAQKIKEFTDMITNRLKFKRNLDKDFGIPQIPPEPTCFPDIDPKVLAQN